MSDIEDFLMSHIEPILRRAQRPVETPDTNFTKENYEKNLINNELKNLEFYSNNLDKLNKKFEKKFKNFKPECSQCPYYLTEQSCKEARKNHDCPKYK